MKLKLDNSLIEKREIELLEEQIKAAYEKMLKDKESPENFLGWVDIDKNPTKEEIDRIKDAARQIRSQSDALLVIGIGGSYLGALAALDAIRGSFYNNLDDEFKVYFAGNNMSESYINDLYKILEGKNFSINVISKSGTTLESALAFRIFKDLLEKKHGKENIKDKIFVTTDKSSGALKKASDKEGYQAFVIPDDVGGRFSVLTPVGLLPMAAAGLNIDKVLEGARSGKDAYFTQDFLENDAYTYAACRNILYRRGKDIEILGSYHPRLKNVAEWWKQLFGESEGKDQKGIFPASIIFSTDLHSMGQLIQDGKRNIFETIINVTSPSEDISVPLDEDNYDGLNYLSGQTIFQINQAAYQGSLNAHVEGNVPNIVIDIESIDEFNLGKLFYFFMISVSISAYMLGVNPFDQPGVESYKANMYEILGS